MKLNKLLVCLIALVACLAGPGAFADQNCPAEVSVHCGKTPSTVIANNGRQWTTFVQGQHVYVSYSDDLGTTYSTPTQINRQPENIYTNGENRPKIQLGKRGEVYLSWTEKTKGNHTGNIRFSYSLNGGKSFEPPRTVNNDGLLTSHRFDQLYVSPSGKVFVAWLDKRDQVKRRAAGGQYTGSAVYYAVSTDSGRSFGENIKVVDHSCECCRLAMAPAEEDNVALIWRHIFATNTRDHAVALLSADGPASDFNRATYDNWKVDACPHHGPDLAYAAAGSYHMAWFSDGEDHKGIYYGKYNFSDASIKSVHAVDTRPAASHPQVAEFAGHVYFVWKFFDGKRTTIEMIESQDKGNTWSAQQTIASTDSSSDHPLLVKHSDGIYLSWHVENSYRFERLHPRADNKTELQPFGTGSLEEIQARYAGQPFLLALWSLECPPCFKELDMLSRWIKEHPRQNLVLISTDSPDSADQVRQLIGKYGLSQADNWIASDHIIERFRFTIDPGWHGELPRSYLYSAQHKRHAYSGTLPEQMVNYWLVQSLRLTGAPE